jgi:hypothetical protein
LPTITSWKNCKLKLLLTPKAQSEFETEVSHTNFLLFNKLGQFQSSGKPQFGSKGIAFSERLGGVDIVSYTVPVVFDTGPAVIKANLVINGDYYIN